MADDDTINPLGIPTTNYGWTKPAVGADVDVWGGYLNTDLDQIDSTVKSVSTVANAAYPASNPTGYIADAPNNTNTYARKGAAWTILPPAGVTISDTAPSSPSQGQLWWDSVGGQLYVYFTDANSSQWTVAVNAGAILLPASTTVLGAVKVDGTTIQAAADGTISTMVVPMGDNRIINGDMRIDQRNNGVSGTASGYTADRWQYQGNQASKGTWGRAGSGLGPFPYALSFTSSSAYASVATDYFCFSQPIEADMVTDFQWGTINAQPVTLSFWAFSSLAGIFGGSVRNVANNRAYPFSYSLVASTWTKFAITIPGDTSGTWAMYGNLQALNVSFDLGSGSNNRGPAGVWASTPYLGVTGAVSVVAANGATFYVTGVKLEIGSVATAYNRQSLAKSMADCQRYYSDPAFGAAGTAFQIGGYTASVAISTALITLPVAMRATPTLVLRNQSYGGGASAVNVVAQSFQTVSTSLTASATGNAYGYFNMTASAEL